MIIAKVSRLSHDKEFGDIIRLVLEKDLEQMPSGINKIKGDDVFVNRIRGVARSLADSQAEIHREYVDIHLALTTKETLGFAVEPASSLFMTEQCFDNDCELKTNIGHEQFITLEPHQYCVFYPSEWHRPMIQVGSEEEWVDKVVIKVRASIL
ncbi:DUF386 domain-containing protein [Vibrio sinensis]|uniref:DUF386 domain-containing protein n=1 Tax=Vibrio sinensis TaxID=2302434 RepID=A0A3A6RG45_9VIBR|nr:YhcH/YjgK/YiaL family protein [Vibrio sinensis]RJX75681.1 DUF386 domain-containing protein [Vibrio sinensis]